MIMIAGYHLIDDRDVSGLGVCCCLDSKWESERDSKQINPTFM